MGLDDARYSNPEKRKSYQREYKRKYMRDYRMKNPLSKEKSKQISNRRSIKRRQLFEEMKMSCGGKCSMCGYNKCIDALDFHHINPLNKKKLSKHPTYEKLKEEVKKCVLLCSNCHREVHAPL